MARRNVQGVSGMNVVQCNCQRAYAVMCDLGEMLCERRVSVALLQEPCVKNGRIVGLPLSMDVIVCESECIKAAVVVNDPNLDVMCVRECTDEHGVCVWLKGDFGEMYVVSVYCRFGEDIEPYLTYLDRVRMVARGKCLLVGMDANAVSPLWYSKGRGGGRENELRDGVLEELIGANDMIVLNEPSESYTFSGPNGESDIDVTLVGGMTGGCRFEWEVRSDWGISDHNVLLIRMIYGENAERMESVRRWVCKDVDWEGYMSDLVEYASEDGVNLLSNRSANDLAEHVSSWILRANDKRMKRRMCGTARKLVWWTDELERMKRDVRKCRRAYQRMRGRDRNRVEGCLNAYKCALREYKRMIWRVKEENWRQFVSDKGNQDPWGDVYKVCMGKYGRDRLSGMRVGDRVTSTWKESVNVLLDRFFPDTGMEGERMGDERMTESVTDERSFEWEEVDAAVKAMRVGKAPGLDGITAGMLRAVWRAIPGWLKRVYDVCLSTGCFPEAWKKARVIVLLKSPEKVRSDPGSYRPICLLSVLGKVLERLMVNRLERLMEGRMCEAQHGFVKGRSTESAWNSVRECVNGSVHKYVLGLFVDFQGAFDNLEWPCVLERLLEIGCEEIGLWKSYFSERWACMVGANEEVWKIVRRGAPQGSIGGPFIWDLQMDLLLWELRRRGCMATAYADDLFVPVEGQSRADLERMGNEWMRIVSEWGMSVGVRVSESKTVMMLMKGSLSGARHPSVSVNGKHVRYVKSVRYLGVWVSERMSYKPHLECMRTKCVSVVGKLRRVMRSEWGLRKRAWRVLYKGLFAACVMYGASVWYEAMKYAYAREAVNRCQRVAISACLNVCRTVSTEAMQVLMGGLPWDLECVRRGMSARIKNGWRLGVNDFMSDEEVNARSVDESLEMLSARLYERWQNRWDNSVKGRVTYGFIRDVRFAEACPGFEPSLWLGYILTGHGSLNEFLYKRGLSETESCACGAECEDWKHVLAECDMYEDIRNLDEWGVSVNENGEVDVSRVLECKERYESLSRFAASVFQRRMSGNV